MSALPAAPLACRVCGETAPYRLVAPGDRTGERIAVHYCRRCKAHYTAPPAYDYHSQDEGLIAYYEAHRAYIVWRHNRILDYLGTTFGLESGRFLDIGSGAGYALEVAQNRGWDVRGIEPGNTLAEYSKLRLGGRVTRGYFTPELCASLRAANPAGHDYMLIDNVLEHVSEPVEFMKLALSLLTENGVALVAVPPVDWLRVLLGRSGWVRARSRSAQVNLFYDPEQHVNYFSRRAMRRLVGERLGHVLLPQRFHHSWILDNPLARLCGFETGYYFIARAGFRS